MAGKPLCVIPTYITDEKSYELTKLCIQSLVETTHGDADIVVVDDKSPYDVGINDIESGCNRIGVEVIRKPVNSGFSKTINYGLRLAQEEGRDAILVNADIQFIDHDWLEHMMSTNGYVVGAKLLYPSGLIQHAGVYYSVLGRGFDHIYRNAPGDLAEADLPRVCPVTGALQLIRNESLNFIGLYDENFSMSFEDVDYCIRVFDMGRECVYQPKVRAIHHEMAFRGKPSEKLNRWHKQSIEYLYKKHAGKDFGGYMPTLLVSGEGVINE